MGILDKAIDLFTGGLGDRIVDVVQDYFPPDMSEAEKEKAALAMRQQAHKECIEMAKETYAEREQFNNRIRDLEGTAKDLQQFGWLGSIVLFLRASQRSIWGFMVLWMDIMWFSGQWDDMSQQQESALWVINLLVLGFLFGERAIKNVAPLINQVIQSKKAAS
jgi:hypothetical protein